MRYNHLSELQLYAHIVYLVINSLNGVGIAKLIFSQRQCTDLSPDEMETRWLPELLAGVTKISSLIITEAPWVGTSDSPRDCRRLHAA